MHLLDIVLDTLFVARHHDKIVGKKAPLCPFVIKMHVVGHVNGLLMSKPHEFDVWNYHTR